MKVTGIIAEYNPFHPGHQFHIAETKRLTAADRVVVVMSGDYVQRGEPAIADKKLRTEMALLGGADLVLELPAYYATASAEYFATAGVKLLEGLGCIDILSFGGETDDLQTLDRIAAILVDEPEEYKTRLKSALKEGASFPDAREQAVLSYLEGVDPGPDPEPVHAILKGANNILALEYLKALKRTDSKMQPLLIRRQGSDYHDDILPSAQAAAHACAQVYPSATAIRKAVTEGRFDDLNRLSETFIENCKTGNYVVWEDLMPHLGYLHTTDPDRIANAFGMDTDLENRVIKALDSMAGSGYVTGFDSLVKMVHTRTYTDTAIRRSLLHVVLGMEKADFLTNAAAIPVPYAKILGFRKASSDLVKMIRETASVDLIQKPGEGLALYEPDSPAGILYDTDLRVTKLYRRIATGKSGAENKEEIMII